MTKMFNGHCSGAIELTIPQTIWITYSLREKTWSIKGILSFNLDSSFGNDPNIHKSSDCGLVCAVLCTCNHKINFQQHSLALLLYSLSLSHCVLFLCAHNRGKGWYNSSRTTDAFSGPCVNSEKCACVYFINFETTHHSSTVNVTPCLAFCMSNKSELVFPIRARDALYMQHAKHIREYLNICVFRVSWTAIKVHNHIRSAPGILSRGCVKIILWRYVSSPVSFRAIYSPVF